MIGEGLWEAGDREGVWGYFPITPAIPREPLETED